MDSSAADIESGFAHFLNFVEAFYRDSGWEQPAIDGDAYSGTAFKVSLNEVTLSIGHDPFASGDAVLFVHCVLGSLPEAGLAQLLCRVLESSAGASRFHDLAYCIEPDTHELACFMRKKPDIDVAELKADLELLVHQALEWRAGRFEGAPLASVPLAPGPAALRDWNALA